MCSSSRRRARAARRLPAARPDPVDPLQTCAAVFARLVPQRQRTAVSYGATTPPASDATCVSGGSPAAPAGLFIERGPLVGIISERGKTFCSLELVTICACRAQLRRAARCLAFMEAGRHYRFALPSKLGVVDLCCERRRELLDIIQSMATTTSVTTTPRVSSAHESRFTLGYTPGQHRLAGTRLPDLVGVASSVLAHGAEQAAPRCQQAEVPRRGVAVLAANGRGALEDDPLA